MELEIIEKNIIELEVVEKYNPYHGPDGRFTSPGGAASFTIGNKSGLAWNQKNVDRAIEREKKRTGGSDVKSMQSEFDMLGNKMQELAQFAVPGANYNERKASEYYETKSKRDDLRRKINEALDAEAKPVSSKPKKFINGYGEATSREITSGTYERAQRRMQRDVENFLKR